MTLPMFNWHLVAYILVCYTHKKWTIGLNSVLIQITDRSQTLSTLTLTLGEMARNVLNRGNPRNYFALGLIFEHIWTKAQFSEVCGSAMSYDLPQVMASEHADIWLILTFPWFKCSAISFLGFTKYFNIVRSRIDSRKIRFLSMIKNLFIHSVYQRVQNRVYIS